MSGSGYNLKISIRMSDTNRKKIMELADAMAGAYCDKSAQGYDNFAKARDELKDVLNTMDDFATL